MINLVYNIKNPLKFYVKRNNSGENVTKLKITEYL